MILKRRELAITPEQTVWMSVFHKIVAAFYEDDKIVIILEESHRHIEDHVPFKIYTAGDKVPTFQAHVLTFKHEGFYLSLYVKEYQPAQLKKLEKWRVKQEAE